MSKNKKWYLSSADSKKLSRTVTGFFTVGVVSAIVLALGFLGIELSAEEANTIIESIGVIIANIGVIGGSIYGLYGAILKVYNNNK